MSLKVTGVYFSASSAGPGPGKMKATIRAARHHPPPPSSLAPQPIHYVHHGQQQQLPSAGGRNANNGNNMSSSPAGNDQQSPVKSNKSRIISNNQHYSNSHHHSHLHSQSLDYLHLNFEEKRQIIASSLSLVDFLHHPPVKVKGRHSHSNGTHVGVGGVTGIGSGQPVPTPINSWNNLPLERSKSKFASLSRLFKPWKWRVRRKSDKLESVSQTLERKMSMRAHRDELIQKGILLPDLANATSPTNASNTLSTIAESKRDKERTKEESHSSSIDSGYQPYSGAGSTTASGSEAASSRCSQSSSALEPCQQSDQSLPANAIASMSCLPSATASTTSSTSSSSSEQRPLSLHVTSPLSNALPPPASSNASPKTTSTSISTSSSSSSYAWNKRTGGTGLVGAAKARGWLRSYHHPSASSASNSDAVDSNASSSSAPPSPSHASGEQAVSSAASALSGSTTGNHSNSSSTSQTMATSTTSTSGAVSTSSASSACITQSFAASLNAALASGPLMPGTIGHHSQSYDSSSTSSSSSPPPPPPAPPSSSSSSNTMTTTTTTTFPIAATATATAAGSGSNRPNSLPAGMAPGHGLLSALVGHSSSAGTPPTQLRQTTTTQMMFNSSSSSSSSASPAASAVTATASTTTTTTSSSSAPTSVGGPSTTSAAATMSMSSAYSQVVTSIAQRNSQAQHLQGSGSPSVMSKLPGRAATLPLITVATASPTTTTTSANSASGVTTVTTSTTITVGSHPANRSPVNAMTVQLAAVTSSSAEASQSAGHHSVQALMTDLPEPPIGVTEIGPIPPPPMFSSPSPVLPPRGAHSAPPPTHGIHLAHLAPPAVASSSPNLLTNVGHDLSDLQDDDVPEESVDDSDSERGVPPAANWVRAQGPKEPSLHAKPLKSALKKPSGSGSSVSNSPSTPSTPTSGTPTQDSSPHGGRGVAWQQDQPPPPPPPARRLSLRQRIRFSTRPLRFGISLGGGSSSHSNSNSTTNNGAASNGGSAHDHNHNMQLKSDNNNRELSAAAGHAVSHHHHNPPASHHHHHPPPPPPPAKGQRPTYLPVAVTAPVQCDYDSDESDGPILYRDDDEENMSEEAKLNARIARKDSLALKLAMRPDRQELIERGILHAQTERERHMQRETIGARLTRRLSLRPTQEELEERNILKRTSPAEEKKEREEKKMTLFRKLSFRPTVEELKARKIIRFNDYVEVADAQDYDRRADRPWTRLTPQEKAAIRKELNDFKSTEMMVHVDSLYMIRFHK
ncbi:LOW QUALITY PROTEIN: serine-rich adhesin for platelets-like [Daphnia carinata]|uniref:LOW QUALITY PROTEIN: serine-rich adhesin for platelets-like n=1 Tax=Daphnia carinata TaxID=120202 RepID=UPI00257EEF95|nr:LOW QUALITY PROTEIN: serine-rich adhesin for platelets-like [Daphnia carinata]